MYFVVTNMIVIILTEPLVEPSPRVLNFIQHL